MKIRFVSFVVLLLLGVGAVCQAQPRRAAARPNYIGCWSDASGARLSVTAQKMRYGRGKWVKYADLTKKRDGASYLLKTFAPGEFNFLSEVITVSLEGDKMQMTLYESLADYNSGKQLGRDTWYREQCEVDARRSSSLPEEAMFSVEGSIKNPVEIPNAVLRRLAQDGQFQRCYDDIEKRTEKPSMQEWFSAAAVRLDGDARADLVVKAEHPCLLGANIGPFWVFRNAGRGRYSLVLDLSTLSLHVLRTKTNGLRDIRISAATAQEVLTAVYKFDGKKYRLPR